MRFYDIQIERYLAEFNRSKILILLYEELKDIDTLMSKIFSFLGVNPSFKPDVSKRYNTSSSVDSFISQPLTQAIDKIPSNIREQLHKYVPKRIFDAYMRYRLTGFRKSGFVGYNENQKSSTCPPEAKKYLLPINRFP